MGFFVSKCVKLAASSLIFFLVCFDASSQPRYLFSRYRNTIPTIIEDISQDAYGRICIGSWSGLYRFDGEDFQNFKNVEILENNELSPSQRFDIVEPDSYGNIWILGNDKSLNFFDGKSEKISRYDESLYKNLVKISGDDFFFITDDNHVHRSSYSADGEEIELVSYTQIDPDATIHGIHKDFSGAIWIYSDRGLFKDKVLISDFPAFCCEEHENKLYFGSTDGRISKYASNELSYIESGIKADIRIISKNSEGQDYIVGSATKGLFSLNPDNMDLHRIKGSSYYVGEWKSLKDDKGNIWIYSEEGSLNWYDPQERELKPFYNEELQQGWDSELYINSLFIDAQNTLWIGGSWMGLEKAIPNNEEFKIKELAPYDASPERQSTRAIMQTADGNMLVSTKDGSIHLLDSNLDMVLRWNSELPVYDICQDENGTIWMASKEGGILEFPAQDWSSASELNYIRYINGLNYYSPIGNKAYCVQADANDRLWIAYFDESVSYLNISQAERHFISKRNMISFPTKYQNRTRYICFSEDGELYSCGHLGIHVCSNPGAEAEELHFDPIECVEGMDIQHLIFMGNDEMYASSFGHGFIHMTKKEGEWTARAYTVEDGLHSNYVLSAIRDNEGNIWIATYSGLNKLLPQSERIISYTPERLGYNLSFNEGEPIIGNDGNIYFNTNRGLLYFNPDEISLNSYKPQIYIKNCYIDNKRVSLDNKQAAIKIRKSNRLLIDFNSIDMTNPDGVTYSYRLNGRNWNNMGENSTIIFDQLRPGRHKLEVKSTNAEGYEVNNVFYAEILVKHDLIDLILLICIFLILAALVHQSVKRRQRKKDAEINAERDRFIKSFHSYIEKNIDNSSLGVNDMASEFGMSRSSFYNKISGCLGMSPAEYLRGVRLKKACELLDSQELPIAQIAYMTGFNDPHYFSKAFKKEFGKTPSEYRKGDS